MSQYLLRIGESLATALESAACSQPGQLAGYLANIEFWIGEYRHLVEVSNGYDHRFRTMANANTAYLVKHGPTANRDDSCVPYQDVIKTSQRHERNEIVTRCRTLLERIIQRGLKFEILGLKLHEDLLARIENATTPKPNLPTDH